MLRDFSSNKTPFFSKKRKEILSRAMTQMDLEATLRETSQSRKDKHRTLHLREVPRGANVNETQSQKGLPGTEGKGNGEVSSGGRASAVHDERGKPGMEPSVHT